MIAFPCATQLQFNSFHEIKLDFTILNVGSVQLIFEKYKLFDIMSKSSSFAEDANENMVQISNFETALESLNINGTFANQPVEMSVSNQQQQEHQVHEQQEKDQRWVCVARKLLCELESGQYSGTLDDACTHLQIYWNSVNGVHVDELKRIIVAKLTSELDVGQFSSSLENARWCMRHFARDLTARQKQMLHHVTECLEELRCFTNDLDRGEFLGGLQCAYHCLQTYGGRLTPSQRDTLETIIARWRAELQLA
jgi:hypothetical protein